jgi:phytoene dehydrogenase-like protein
VTDFDAVVIGAGHNALVAATYLGRAGLRVGVFERLSRFGGAAVTDELVPGIHFSPCAHQIHGVHPKIVRDLGLWARGLDVIPRPYVFQLLPDGSYYGPPRSASAQNRSLDVNMSVSERQGVARYEEFQSRLLTVIARYRLSPPPSVAEVLQSVEGSPDEEVIRLAVSTRLWDIQDEFLPTYQTRDRYAGELSSVSRDALTLALAHSAMELPEEETGERPPFGYVRGGMGRLTGFMADAAKEAGVELHLNAAVGKLLVEGGATVGVKLASRQDIRADLVLSGLDPKRTLLGLVPQGTLTTAFTDRVRSIDTSVSCMKLLAAATELPAWKDWDGDPALLAANRVKLFHTRTHVSAAFDDVERRQPPKEPPMTISIQSAVDSVMAPSGLHTIAVFIAPAPFLLAAGTWDSERETVTERIVELIDIYAPNFRRSIVWRTLRTPLDFERDYGMTDGCIWHVLRTGEQLLRNRPLPELADYRTPIRGLYMCGSGQHPGGEVTGMPGHNAAHQVLRDLGSGGSLTGASRVR